METFASIADYEKRYGVVDDRTMLQACLEDATDDILLALEWAGIDTTNPTAAQKRRWARVCRQVAQRVMPTKTTGGIPAGASSASWTMGPFSQSVSYQAPWGSTKIRSEELALLGVDTQVGGFIYL